jgi:glycosyltransferase 2 family protein
MGSKWRRKALRHNKRTLFGRALALSFADQRLPNHKGRMFLPVPTRSAFHRLIFGLLVSGVCAALVLRYADLPQSLAALKSFRLRYFALPFAAFAINIPLRAWRWQLLFPRPAPAFGACFKALAIGNMGNMLAPARAGDVARCALIGRKVSLTSSTQTAATLGVEKVLDGMALISLLLLSTFFVSPPHWVTNAAVAGGTLLGSGMLAMVLLHYRAEDLLGWVGHQFVRMGLRNVGDNVVRVLGSFAQGLGILSSPRQMTRVFALTVLIWMSEAALIWALVMAMGLSVSLGAGVVVCTILGVSMMVPAAPSAIGTYEVAGVTAFKLFNFASGDALAATLAIHGWVFLTNTALGLISVGLAGMRLADLTGGGQRERQAPAAGGAK